MSDLLTEFLKSCDCSYDFPCPYGSKIQCDDCIKRMIQEHDVKVKAEVINECIRIVTHYWYHYNGIKQAIREIRELKW